MNEIVIEISWKYEADKLESVMDKYARKIDTPISMDDERCWQEIGNNPVKLAYLKEIERLWKESNGADAG